MNSELEWQVRLVRLAFAFYFYSQHWMKNKSQSMSLLIITKNVLSIGASRAQLDVSNTRSIIEIFGSMGSICYLCYMMVDGMCTCTNHSNLESGNRGLIDRVYHCRWHAARMHYHYLAVFHTFIWVFDSLLVSIGNMTDEYSSGPCDRGAAKLADFTVFRLIRVFFGFANILSR